MLTLSVFVSSLLFLAATHFVGDYAFQSAWMAMKKNPNNFDPTKDSAGPWEVLTYHALTYTATFLIALELRGEPYSLWVIPIIFISHEIVDALKARNILVKKIWQDQVLHMVPLALLVLVGWV